MALTLTKPATGELNWGNTLNNNFTAIETAVNDKAEEADLSAHRTNTSAHAAINVSSAAITGQVTVDTALNYLNTNKAALVHTHPDSSVTSSSISGQTTVAGALGHLSTNKAALVHTHRDDEIIMQAGTDLGTAFTEISTGLSDLGKSVSDIEALLNLLNPNLASVTVGLEVSALSTGILCHITTTPSIYVRNYSIAIKLNGNYVYNGGASSSYLYSYAFRNGDVIEVTGSITAGLEGVKSSVPVTIVWHNPNPDRTIIYDFTPDTDIFTLSEEFLQDLLGWDKSLENSINDGIGCFIQSKKNNPHTNITSYNIEHRTDNSVDHLKQINISNLSVGENYKITLYINKVNVKV